MKKKGSQGVEIARGTGDGMYVSFPGEPLRSGDEIRFAVRPDADGEKLLEKTVTDFTADGKAFIGFSEEDTLSLAADEYVYGVQVIRSGAEPVDVIREAPFVVKESVARNE